MKLVGMFDSPYVRRVAISMRLLDIPFEHLNWSIGKDQDQVKRLNPLGQVPILVLEDGSTILDSTAVLDYLDDRVGPDRALVPPTGDLRRRVLAATTLATGLADKARLQNTELLFAAAAQLHALCAQVSTTYLFGERITQADISLGCGFTYASETAKLTAPLPALRARCARLAELPVFREIYLPFDAPVI